MGTMQPAELRERLDLWTATRAAYEALESVMELEERSGYETALRQLYSAELDAAADLARVGIEVHTRGEEDPPTGLGLIDVGN